MSINSQKVLYNKVGGDESFTPSYGVKPILKYIKLHVEKHGTCIVWLPFDKKESEYAKQIVELDGVFITCSHIDNNQDFFTYEPMQWDIIVSNPPFKNKRAFFERALSFKKPFALLMTNAWLNDKYSKWVFKEANREMQLLMFDKRIHFKQDGETKKKTTFSSSYFCCDFLPKQIILEELDENS